MKQKKSVFLVAFAMLFILLGAWLFANGFYQSSQSSVLEMLEGVAAQNTLILQKEVEHAQARLNDIRAYMEQGDGDLNECMRRLTAVDSQNAFKRMGIITEDGIAHCTDGAGFNAEDRKYFQQSIAGEFAVSDTLVDKVDGQKINVASVSLRMTDGSPAVLFAVYSSDKYAEVLSAPSFGGAGYSFVIKQDGTCVVDSVIQSDFGTFENFFDLLLQEEQQANNQAVEEMHRQIETVQSGSMTVQRNHNLLVHYESLGINDWVLMTVVPQEVVREQSAIMLTLAYGFTIVCAAIMILLMVHVIRLRDGGRRALEQLAYVDPITGKATQARFLIDVNEVLQKHPDRLYAMVQLNLEKFQYINDLFGYEEGDNALRYCADAMMDMQREGECFARLQGDQFGVLWHFDNEERLIERLNALQEYFNGCGDRGNQRYMLKFKAGVCGATADQPLNRVIDCANLALQKAKKDAVKQVVFYDESMRREKMLAKSIGDSFEEALQKGEFVPWFQPKYDLKKKCFDGAEALVRWQTPDGLISPGAFVPVLEQNGGIRALDRYMFESVCKLLAEWRSEGLSVSPVSVNISRLHLYDMDFVQHYLQVLQQYHVPSEMVQLELTETVLFDNEGELRSVLGSLRDQGIKLQMDDFGAGYSSVKMMTEAPIDVLKLDKTLVDASEQASGRSILEGITALAHRLGIRVTAEGVETQAQFEIMEQVGCDWVQGYYCSRPMPADDYRKLLQKQ